MYMAGTAMGVPCLVPLNDRVAVSTRVTSQDDVAPNLFIVNHVPLEPVLRRSEDRRPTL